MENNKIVVANFKSYMTLGEIKNYLRIVYKNINLRNVIFCPSNIYVPYFLEENLEVGIQNITCFNCTGEITVEQIKSNNIKHCIVGHSERRSNFCESDVDINKKVIKLLDNNINVILCVGETLEEKNRFKTNLVLKRQLINCLRGIKNGNNLVIAYEPVWSIGTNNIPSNSDIESIVNYIKSIVKKILDVDVKVLYGGSVNRQNIALLNTVKNLDGFLIGKASTDANEFLEILEVVVNQ